MHRRCCSPHSIEHHEHCLRPRHRLRLWAAQEANLLEWDATTQMGKVLFRCPSLDLPTACPPSFLAFSPPFHDLPHAFSLPFIDLPTAFPCPSHRLSPLTVPPSLVVPVRDMLQRGGRMGEQPGRPSRHSAVKTHTTHTRGRFHDESCECLDTCCDRLRAHTESWSVSVFAPAKLPRAR